MKTFKTILITLTFLIIAQTGFSQISVGYRYGTRYSMAYSIDYYRDSIFSMPSQAIVLDIFTQKYIGSRIEIGTSSAGWHRIGLDRVEDKRVLNFIEVPYLAKGSAGYKAIRLVAEIGIYGSYAMSGTHIIIENGQRTVQDYTFDPDLDNRFIYGLMGGAGLEVRTKFIIVTAQARVSQSLRDAYKVYNGYDTKFNMYRNIEGMASIAIPLFGRK